MLGYPSEGCLARVARFSRVLGAVQLSRKGDQQAARISGVAMTHDLIKVLLMLLLFGGLRMAMFTMEMPRSGFRLRHRMPLHRSIAPVSPAKLERAWQPIGQKSHTG